MERFDYHDCVFNSCAFRTKRRMNLSTDLYLNPGQAIDTKKAIGVSNTVQVPCFHFNCFVSVLLMHDMSQDTYLAKFGGQL